MVETLNEQQIEDRIEELQARIGEIKAEIADLKAQLPKQPGKLTAAFCKDVKHSGAKGAERHTAGPGGHGLALVVQPGGTKSFTQRLAINGKRTDVGLGAFPVVSLQQARDAAFENVKTVRAGGGPSRPCYSVRNRCSASSFAIWRITSVKC